MTRAPANRLGMYADVREVLDVALRHDGGQYNCAAHGDAVHWRQRAYRFRKLFAQLNGEKKESPYDVIVMPRIPDDSSTVVIKIRRQVGLFVPNSAEPTGGDIFMDDELFDEAAALAARLEGLPDA